MRFLELDESGEISLTENFIGDAIPRYGVLSHTWGPEIEEVSFRDMKSGTGNQKIGYQKIKFCSEQAKCDGLRYFWVDTCCIDSSNLVELSEAINSMFRWYSEAVKCYVYLTDLPSMEGPWETTFRQSRWFTRGWTLQELLAPDLVEFYSYDGKKVGTKKSLQQSICEITGIPMQALEGTPLFHFSIPERISWQESRSTKYEEDKAYSILGICEVYMPLIYGEGMENAFKRLRREIETGSKGIHADEFSVAFSLFNVFDVEDFVGREVELQDIYSSLSGDGSRRSVVLYGLGGIGKTQLAVAYAKKQRDRYSAIFWLDATSNDALKQSFVVVAKQILKEHPSASGLSHINMKELDDVVDGVKEWLSVRRNTRWLMIFDNNDNPRVPGNTNSDAVDLRKYLPQAYQGSVIITTRSSRVTIGNCLRIGKLLETKHSLEILSNTSQRRDLAHDPHAVELVSTLDGLPLALATAGSYLFEAAMSCQDYIRLYQTSWANLQMMTPDLESYEDRTLYSTWQISYDHVKKQNELSAKILCLWAYFDSQDLWFDLIHSKGSQSIPWISELTENELKFHNAMRVLCNHGLVEIGPSSDEKSRGYSIHNCVHSWTSSVLNSHWDGDLAQQALRSTALNMPKRNVADWALIQRRLLKHASRCYYLIVNDLMPVSGVEWALQKLGELYTDQSKLMEAEVMYKRALDGRQKLLGPDHIDTLDTINRLGILYQNQGKLGEAEVLFKRALAGREKALGPEHESTLNTVHHLGILYRNSSRLAESKAMYERALSGREKTLGPEDISTLHTISSLSILLRDLGRWDEAEKSYERCISGYEKLLGPDHISTLYTVNSLAILYRKQDRLAESEELHQRVLAGREKAFGPDNASTLHTVDAVGALYREQGKLKEAEQMVDRALRGREKHFGADHSVTLETVENMGLVYRAQSRFVEAEKMHKRALAGREKALGETHAHTLDTIESLGVLFRDQGRFEESEQMHEQALAGREKTLGMEHTSTLDTIESLGLLYRKQGRLAEAELMHSQALAGREQNLGLEHPHTKASRESLRAVQDLVAVSGSKQAHAERRKNAQAETLSPRSPAIRLLS